MIPALLEAEIERAKREGGVPFFVSATAGTTVLGAFDPFHEIADICEKHKLWFHVDVSAKEAMLVFYMLRVLVASILQ